jgi:hypothetical protein
MSRALASRPDGSPHKKPGRIGFRGVGAVYPEDLTLFANSTRSRRSTGLLVLMQFDAV